MKKFLGFLFVILLIAIGLGLLAWRNAAPLLSSIISKKMQCPVTIEQVAFASKSFTIKNFVMANPKEAKLPTALKVESTQVTAPYINYFKNPIFIDKIQLNNLYVNIQIYNQEQTQGNWNTIFKNIDTKKRSFFSVERPAIISTLLLLNIQVDLILSDGKLHKISIPKLEFHNINTKESMPIQEISEIIMQKIIHSILKEKILESLLPIPKKLFKGLFPFGYTQTTSKVGIWAMRKLSQFDDRKSPNI